MQCEDIPVENWQFGEFNVSTDKEKLDLDWVYNRLSQESWWAKGQTRERIERSIAYSLPYGIYNKEGSQVGFARVVTDYTRFIWVCDVFVDANYRGKGLANFMMHCITSHPMLQEAKRWLLSTTDKHSVYQRAGWQVVEKLETLMEYPIWKYKGQ